MGSAAFQFAASAPPPRTETTSSHIRCPNADILGAHAREHILGEAHQHRQGNTLIELQREDAILARLLGPFFQIFADGHGSPPVATVM